MGSGKDWKAENQMHNYMEHTVDKGMENEMEDESKATWKVRSYRFIRYRG